MDAKRVLEGLSVRLWEMMTKANKQKLFWILNV